MSSPMAPSRSSLRLRGTKRRKIDTAENVALAHDAADSNIRESGVEKQAEFHPTSTLSRSSVTRVSPVIRPPDAPFYPDAIRMWVVRDPAGQKRLVSERVHGCRHWRIGDPNISYCFECNKTDGDLVGCWTCKRSYHISCLKSHIPEETTSRGRFYCPTCIERGWDVQPPPEILPLTPGSSREASPVPSMIGAAPTSVPGAQAGQGQSRPDAVHTERGSNQPVHSSMTDHGTVHHGSPTPHQDQAESAQLASATPDVPTTSTRPSPPRFSALAQDTLVHESRFPVAAHGADSIDKATAGAKKKKSRYQTMPDEVDQAITTIYRELESVAKLRLEIKLLQDQLQAATQARQILEGRLALERSGREEIALKEVEIVSLKQQLHSMTSAHDAQVQENNRLKQRIEEQNSIQAKLDEMQALKSSLRRLLGD